MENRIITLGIEKEIMDYHAAKQMMSQWCWAASIKTVLNYYGVSITQQDVVARTYGVTDRGTLLNRPADFETIHNQLNNWILDSNGNRFKVKAQFFNGPPPPGSLIDEMYNKRPLILGYNTGPQTGHAVVVTSIDYYNRGADRIVSKIVVRDPWPSEENIKNKGRVEFGGKDLASITHASWRIRVEKE